MLALSTDSQVAAPCGCELFRSGSDGKSVTFRYCDTHAAAPELLKALESIKSQSCCAAETLDDNISRDTPQNTMNELLTINQLACAAIKATKGDA